MTTGLSGALAALLTIMALVLVGRVACPDIVARFDGDFGTLARIMVTSAAAGFCWRFRP